MPGKPPGTQSEKSEPGPPSHFTAPPLSPEEQEALAPVLEQTKALLAGPNHATGDGKKGRNGSEVLAAIKTLPKDQQGKLIEQMDEASLKQLIAQVPKAERLQFKDMIDNTRDPEKKLLLWSVFHSEKVRSDGNQRKKEGQKDTSRFDDIYKSTDREIDEELVFIDDQKKQGHKPSLEDINELIKRKEKESEIELEYNVNLTNRGKTDKTGNTSKDRKQDEHPSDRVYWSLQELEQARSAFARMPPELISGKDGPTEIRRASHAYSPDGPGKWKPLNNVGGITYYESGIIEVFGHNKDKHDKSSVDSSLIFPYRISTSSDQEPSTPIDSSHNQDINKNGKISPFEEMLIHEVGHNAASKHIPVFEEFRKTVNPRSVGNENDTQKEIEKYEKDPEKVKDYIGKLKKDETVVAGGNRYHCDPVETPTKSGSKQGTVAGTSNGNGPSYQCEAINEGSIPKESYSPDEVNEKTPVPDAQKTAASGDGENPWGYTKNSDEHFAEHFVKAVTVPKKLFQDLIESPKQRIARLQKNGGTPEQIADAERDAEARRRQFDLMRNKIFHTDGAVQDLISSGTIPKAREAEFRAQAGELSTPEQVRELAKKFSP